ncbi:MAG: DUF1343 domain-containing protein [Phycisphaerales bacterium]|nr:DUF1343 domain-containing protein [Phycisphaerales bacterium]
MTRIATLVCSAALFVAASLPVRAADQIDVVYCGIDVMARDGFQPLAGRKVGLITNHTGLDRNGKSTLELLHAAPNVTLVAIFSPEHGLKGVLDERVADSSDPLTGLKVYSLYGETRKPSAEMLEGVDTLVFDIQDIGARFYTYIGTMGICMEAAAEHNIRFVVLDRPNPITGTRVSGPLNDREGKFTAYHTIPVMHGMTIGELALMYNKERNINCDLHVEKMEGWKRAMWLEETNLTWVNPSPNMRSLTEATLYPGIGLIEACNVSVGRGTDTPFEVFGAPWIEERKLAARLNGLKLPGIRFLPYRFTPDASKFAGESCGGVQIILTDRDAFKPIETGLSIVRELRNLFGTAFDVDRVNNLLFNQALLEKVKSSTDPESYEPLWRDDMKQFMARRAEYLLYD